MLSFSVCWLGSFHWSITARWFLSWRWRRWRADGVIDPTSRQPGAEYDGLLECQKQLMQPLKIAGETPEFVYTPILYWWSLIVWVFTIKLVVHHRENTMNFQVDHYTKVLNSGSNTKSWSSWGDRFGEKHTPRFCPKTQMIDKPTSAGWLMMNRILVAFFNDVWCWWTIDCFTMFHPKKSSNEAWLMMKWCVVEAGPSQQELVLLLVRIIFKAHPSSCIQLWGGYTRHDHDKSELL